MRKKSLKRKFTAGLSAVMLTGLITTACSGNTPAATKTGQSAAEGPFALSLMIPYFTTEPPTQNNPTLKAIEEYTNTKLNITWIPDTSYDDRLNVNISSNDLTDGVVVRKNKAPNIVQAVRAGMFWEIGPYLKDYKNLSKMNKVVQFNTSYDGKTYSLYRGRVLARSGFIFRKDWLDNLGLQEPKNPDEFYKVLKAFTENDPDKNGKNDTYGLSVNNAINVVDDYAVMIGAPNGWDVKDGKFVPAFMTREYMDALNFFRKIYSEHLMTSDFAVANKTTLTDNFNKGKAGMFYSSLEDSNTLTKDLPKLFPNAKIDVFTRLEGPKGVRIAPSEGWNGMYLFPKSKLKTEADLKKALAFFDKTEDQKLQDLINYGIEGTHYKVDNSVVQIIPEKQDDYLNEQRRYWQMTLNYVENMRPAKQVPIVEKYRKMQNDNVSNVVANPSLPLLSQTLSEVGNELDKIMLDAKTKYISGAMDEAGWNKAIEQWRSRGGDKVAAEFAQEYAKTQKN